MGSRHERIELHNWNGVTVLDLGEMDIWDGADMSLIRDTLYEVIEHRGCRTVGVNLQWVKYIPSGFFGMLSDWHDQGIDIYLYRPQKNVARMLWFRQFFQETDPGCYRLLSEQKDPPQLVVQGQLDTGSGTDWDEF